MRYLRRDVAVDGDPIDRTIRSAVDVGGVDRVVDGAGVRGGGVEDALQYALGLVEERSAVVGDRGDGDARERVERGRVEVVGESLVGLAHAIGPSFDARPVVGRLGLMEEGSGRFDEAGLAVRRYDGARLLRCGPASLKRFGIGSVRPERLEEGSCEPPVGHGAGRVLLRDLGEHDARLLVHHVVHQAQRPIDTVLHPERAIRAEVHGAEFGAVTDRGSVIVGLLVCRAEREGRDHQQVRGASPRHGVDSVHRHEASSSLGFDGFGEAKRCDRPPRSRPRAASSPARRLALTDEP
ncbi:MAG: hypothetical protein H0X64_10785 [Gemmatimonadaceae bacterium]|nr:hypothetical protein [Gemmatimonadaceae bacterium]